MHFLRETVPSMLFMVHYKIIHLPLLVLFGQKNKSLPHSPQNRITQQ